LVAGDLALDPIPLEHAGRQPLERGERDRELVDRAALEEQLLRAVGVELLVAPRLEQAVAADGHQDLGELDPRALESLGGSQGLQPLRIRAALLEPRQQGIDLLRRLGHEPRI
jgi:hypothetical protein